MARSRPKRRWGRVLLVMLALLVVAPLVAPLFMKPNPRLLATRTPADVGLAFESVEFSPPDLPIKVRAWLMQATPSKAAIVLAHGGGEDNRSLPYGQGLELMRDLVASGYTVLAMDMRNFGESDASPDARMSFGLRESNDVIGAVSFLQERGTARRFGALGFSMGGSSVLYAASRDARLEAVVSDSAFADSRAIVSSFVQASMGIPPWLSGPLLWTADSLHGMGLGLGRPVDVVSGIAPRRLLVIHDESDPIVPVEHASTLAKACPGAELWVTDVAKAGDNAFGTHIKSYMYDPKPYVARVVEFFDRTFGR